MRSLYQLDPEKARTLAAQAMSCDDPRLSHLANLLVQAIDLHNIADDAWQANARRWRIRHAVQCVTAQLNVITMLVEDGLGGDVRWDAPIPHLANETEYTHTLRTLHEIITGYTRLLRPDPELVATAGRVTVALITLRHSKESGTAKDQILNVGERLLVTISEFDRVLAIDATTRALRHDERNKLHGVHRAQLQALYRAVATAANTSCAHASKKYREHLLLTDRICNNVCATTGAILNRLAGPTHGQEPSS